PDLMSGADLCCDCGEPHRQVRKTGIPEGVFELACQAAPADQPGASQPEVEIAEHAPAGQLTAPVLEDLKLAGGKGPGDARPDGGTCNHVRTDAVSQQGAQHADMGKSSGCAAAQHKADRESIFRMRAGAREIAGQLSSQHVQIGARPTSDFSYF